LAGGGDSTEISAGRTRGRTGGAGPCGGS
jgi:hypothetical protein